MKEISLYSRWNHCRKPQLIKTQSCEPSTNWSIYSMTLRPKAQGLLSKREAEILYDAGELEVSWENFQRP